MLPFIKTPSDAGFSNNKSALTKGRKWLILDLLYVNDHLYKEKKENLTIGNVLKITYKQIRLPFQV